MGLIKSNKYWKEKWLKDEEKILNFEVENIKKEKKNDWFNNSNNMFIYINSSK